ncbi:hypothetical protein SOVF_213560, partial [Spinacia oleracea]
CKYVFALVLGCCHVVDLTNLSRLLHFLLFVLCFSFSLSSLLVDALKQHS